MVSTKLKFDNEASILLALRIIYQISDFTTGSAAAGGGAEV